MLWSHAKVTLIAILLGFGLTVVTSIPLGLLIALSALAKQIVYPPIMLMQLVPKLIEIAPGLDPERDVMAHMGFRPRVARDLRSMDARIFAPGKMGLAAHVRGKPHLYRSPRVAQWHEARKARRWA